ncbi:MAG: 3-dehydroquinate synthase, partial [Desulfuromonadales bacterium]|nr:3-dehydroquinate synthase [Desulfuromonadales bacterium]
MAEIVVGLGENSYPIVIGERVLPNLGSALDDVGFPEKVAIVTNPTVGDLYCEQVIDTLAASGRRVSVI